jgi:hypothetical protein
MLAEQTRRGVYDACERFGVKVALMGIPPGALNNLAGRAQNFGRGQLDAAKSLLHNLRGGLGGASNLEGVGHLAAGASGPIPDISQLHRRRAVEDIKTMAPSLLAGGGLYMLHKQRAQQAAQAPVPDQNARDLAAATYGGGYPQM